MKRELHLNWAWNESFGAFIAIARTVHPDGSFDVVASCIQDCEADVHKWFKHEIEKRGIG